MSGDDLSERVTLDRAALLAEEKRLYARLDEIRALLEADRNRIVVYEVAR